MHGVATRKVDDRAQSARRRNGHLQIGSVPDLGEEFGKVTTMLGRANPKIAALLTDAQPDLLAFAAFPR